MRRAEKVLEHSEKLVSEDEKPTVRKLSAELKMSEDDVHRCLNSLEKRGKIETYSREIFGKKNRLVSVRR